MEEKRTRKVTLQNIIPKNLTKSTSYYYLMQKYIYPKF